MSKGRAPQPPGSSADDRARPSAAGPGSPGAARPPAASRLVRTAVRASRSWSTKVTAAAPSTGPRPPWPRCRRTGRPGCCPRPRRGPRACRRWPRAPGRRWGGRRPGRGPEPSSPARSADHAHAHSKRTVAAPPRFAPGPAAPDRPAGPPARPPRPPGRPQLLKRKASSSGSRKRRTSSSRSGSPLEQRVVRGHVLGHLAGRRQQVAVAAQAGQLQVAAALLACPQDGPLPPQLEVDLGQLEAVGGPLEGGQPLAASGVEPSASR